MWATFVKTSNPSQPMPDFSLVQTWTHDVNEGGSRNGRNCNLATYSYFASWGLPVRVCLQL